MRSRWERVALQISSRSGMCAKRTLNARRWRNVENVPTPTIFFRGFSWPPPLPSYDIRYVFPSSDVLLNVFFSYGPGSSKILYLHLSLLTYQLINFQITVEDALHASLCTEEHTVLLKPPPGRLRLSRLVTIPQWGWLHGGSQFFRAPLYVRNYRKQWVLQVIRLTSILSSGLVQLKFRQLTTEFSGNQFISHGCTYTPTEVSTQPPERWNVPPSAPLLTHSSAFGLRFLNSERSKPSEMDPWHFPHIPPSPWLYVFRICPVFRYSPASFKLWPIRRHILYVTVFISCLFLNTFWIYLYRWTSNFRPGRHVPYQQHGYPRFLPIHWQSAPEADFDQLPCLSRSICTVRMKRSRSL